tara:strand:+ start:98 stop:541 length:444 start_codon:yes stop_codon:yes gene_type:complete
MILISHRGNIDGPNLERENTKSYIDECIDTGYEVEIDVWMIEDKLFLGHDEPINPVTLQWLQDRSEKLWIHCKNFNSLQFLLGHNELRVFFHEKEKYTIMSNGLVWAHELNETNQRCIIPLLAEKDLISWNPVSVFGVCSDYIKFLK